MAKAKLQEVDVPAENLNTPEPAAPVSAPEYQSSEELQRANRDAFVDAEAKKKAKQSRTEKDKLHAVLDKYIAEHGSTDKIRKLAKENNRTADQQLDLSADLVEILKKIKNELR